MSKDFTCPKCKNRQQLKRMFFLSNTSVWHCHKCNTQIKPKVMSPIAITLGFFSVVIPAYYCMFVLNYDFLKIMAVGAAFGVLAYLLSIVFYYLRVELEEV